MSPLFLIKMVIFDSQLKNIILIFSAYDIMNVLLSKGGKEDSRVDKLFLFKYKRQSC